ncbi:MAG TPA: VOC family protein [Longimicrobium sp.]|jgi:predicted enzyme related to lactoylglutathione lyase|nr:VOC family protein [Longimicrobium sp.]
MTDTPTRAPGNFCWIDLGAHDARAAKDFYTAFFGWTAVDSQYGAAETDVYTMYKLGGRDVAASYAMDANQKAMGMPSSWLSYVAVDDADASAARAKELGASLLAEPFDVMQVGRMALVQDPTGALFALWQAGTHQGVGVRGEPGSLGWNELATNDAARAREFYTALFGWRADVMNVGMEYTLFNGDTGPLAGAYALTPEMEGMPVCWLPYFAVEDPDAMAVKATSLGATVMKEPADIPGIGRFAMIRDPQGAMLYIMRFDPPAG